MPAGPWVLVIGCHRSGTSAITGALVALGLQGVDPQDRIELTSSNPEHWESLGAALYDEDILIRLGGAWDAPPPVKAEQLEVMGGGEPSDPARIMADAYPGSGPLVWKDPRACLLLPYWRAHLPAPLTAVYVWREPLAVARSLHTRDDIPLIDGLALWERYNRSASDGLQGVDTYIVNYDAAVDDPDAELGALADWLTSLGRFGPYAAGDVARAAATIDRRLHHESAAAEDSSSLPNEHRPVAEWLESMAGPHSPLGSLPPPQGSPWPAVVIETRREMARFRRLVEQRDAQLVSQASEHAEAVAVLEALVRSRDTRIQALTKDLEGEVQRYEGMRAHLDRVLGSTSWKVTAPLRAALGRLSTFGSFRP